MRKLLLLRPEPGLSATAERARVLGLEVIACPLFRVEPVEWAAPDPAGFDALLLTSANAVRHGGMELNKLSALPVQAVGAATAAVAREAGFTIETVGEGDVTNLLGKLPPTLRLLHLAGEDHRAVDDPRVERQIVYRSAMISDAHLPPLQGLVAAVHSPRAGERLAELAAIRGATAVAAISSAAADACGSGWECVAVAEQPKDESLLALAARLCHTSSPQ
ncbi:MAG: uroporphyrinogen-III synthase [Pseudomonadota bacterium]|nr:uroporphyrinogen-III synthase [Pseudomonadota bacterium]